MVLIGLSLIDKYYHGEIVKVNGEWRAHLNDKSFLASDDIDH
jgi:hypothetical protein